MTSTFLRNAGATPGQIDMQGVLHAVYRHGQGFTVAGEPLCRDDAGAVQANWREVQRLMQQALPPGARLPFLPGDTE